MTSSAFNSLADKTYCYIQERMGPDCCALGTWFVNRMQIYTLRVTRRHVEE